MINPKDLIKEGKNNLLIISGHSGSGKSYLERTIIEEFPDYFVKLPQITTRNKRKDETRQDYYFVSESTYNFMQPVLIAKLLAFSGNNYGTLPLFKDGMVNTVVASFNAIEDIMENYDKLNLNISLLHLYFNDINKIPAANKRENRNNAFIINEKRRLDIVIGRYGYRFNYSMDLEQDRGWKTPKDIFAVE